MMDHEQYRRTLLADPSSNDPELETHRSNCETCRAFTVQVRNFEQRLTHALTINMPNGAKILPFRAHRAPSKSNRWFALAASVATAFVVAGAIWLGTPRSSLAADVVAHMAEEPEAWNTHAAMPAPELAAVLKRANMTLDPKTAVSYANACRFRGNVVPHLVVQTPQGPVTVMVLIHESVSRQQEFDEQGYRGTILPVPRHGSIAVLTHTPASNATNVDAIAAQVRNAIVWGTS